MYNPQFHRADVAKLVDAPDLGSGAERCESSSLSVRTNIQKRLEILSVFFRLILPDAINQSQSIQGFQADCYPAVPFLTVQSRPIRPN